MEQQEFVSITGQGYLTEKTTLCLPECTRSQEIKVIDTDKRLWLTCTSAKVSSSFSKNKFKTDADSGHVSLELQQEDQSAIENVDAQVYEMVLGDPKYKNVEQVRLTARTWEQMFRRSMFESCLRLSVGKASVAFYDKEKNLLENGWDYLHEDTVVNAVIEPSMLWFMNHKSGISWTLKQVRFLEELKLQETSQDDQESFANWQLEDD